MATPHEADPSCDVAHGDVPPPSEERTLVAVFAGAVADHLLRYGADLGYRTFLVDPDKSREGATDLPPLDATADVVVTDHHRPELGPVLRDVLTQPVRWVGVMGNPGTRPRTSRPSPSSGSPPPTSPACTARSA